MAFFKEDKIIQVSRYDLNTLLFLETIDEYQAEAGFGLPAGYTDQICPSVSGMIGKWDPENNQWNMKTDDRGRVFWDKSTGQKYRTTVLNEYVNPREFTQIEPPSINSDQLLKFETSTQTWIIGLDWYEKPVWNAQQEKSFYTGFFFIPDSNFTNIEPTEEQAGFILNDSGEWVEPEPEEEPEAIEE